MTKWEKVQHVPDSAEDDCGFTHFEPGENPKWIARPLCVEGQARMGIAFCPECKSYPVVVVEVAE